MEQASSHLQVGNYLAARPWLQLLFCFVPAFLVLGLSSATSIIWLICNTACLFFALTNPLIGALDARRKWYFLISVAGFLPLMILLVYCLQLKLDFDIRVDIPQRLQLMLSVISFFLVHGLVAVFRLLMKFLEAN